MEQLGARLSEARTMRGLTLEDVSVRTGLAVGYVCQLETGSQRNPTLASLYRLSQALGVPVGFLVGEVAASYGGVHRYRLARSHCIVQGERKMRQLILHGGGFDTESRVHFLNAAAARGDDRRLAIRILPMNIARDPHRITQGERETLLSGAERRRLEWEELCRALFPDRSVQVELVPILVRVDAYDPAHVAQLRNDVDGVFIMGGYSHVGSKVLGGTPAEAALAALYRQGIPMLGSSAGATLLSRTLFAGFAPGADLSESFRVEQLHIMPEGGLSFGQERYLVDVHLFERGYPGRLLSAVAKTGLVGLGIDQKSAAIVHNERLQGIVGGVGILVVEPPAVCTFHGPEGLVSARGFTVHLLGPGAEPPASLAKSSDSGDRIVGVDSIELSRTVLEPDFLSNRAWERIFERIAVDPDTVVIGLDRGTTLHRNGSRTRVTGRGTVLVADGRNATYSVDEAGRVSTRGIRVNLLVDGDEL